MLTRIVERLACVRAEEQTRAPGAALWERHGLSRPNAPNARRRCVRCGRKHQTKTTLCAACMEKP